MVDDLTDYMAELRDMKARIRQLETGTPFENASVTNGRLRFIGGLLRVDSGGRVEIVGTLSVEGTTQFIGPVTISGQLNVTGDTTISGDTSITGELGVDGPWSLNGDGEITGDVDVTGEFNLDGPWTISGDGDITGDVDVTGDFEVLGGGRIKVGNVIITPGNDGRITVGTGSSQVVISGSTGRIRAGNLVIDPTEGGGSIVFDNGTQLYSHPTGDQIEMVSGSAHVTVREHEVLVGSDATKWIAVRSQQHSEPGIHVGGIREGSGGRYLGIDGTELVKLASGGGGDPGDPPSGNPDGYIWPADPAVFGISDNFAAHVARGSAEPGVDVMTPVGTPLWAPGAGTILAVQSSPAGATGRYVTLITDEGDWFRFLHNSAVVVSAGDTVEQAQLLAYTGGSGFGQEAYYGPHSHISFKVGYTGTFPGAGALNDFEAYMAQS